MRYAGTMIRTLRRAGGWLRARRWIRIGVTAGVGVVLFGAGVAVGDGRLSLPVPHARTENPGLPAQLDYSSVSEVYQTIRQNYHGTLTTTQLLDGLKTGLADATHDPYTEYFNAKDAQDFENSLNNSFSGIGAELGKDHAGNLTIVAPIKGFPADKAGLQAGDIISQINGQSTAGMTPDAAVSKIRGPKGSKVTLHILRGQNEPLTFVITRDDIQVPSVTSKILAGNIGYMEISSFSSDTADLAAQAARSFKRANVRGVILDLRGDPGGYLDAAVSVASLWLPGGTTVVTEKGTAGNKTSQAAGDDTLHGMPTAVLVDGGSASASEIVSGALHDNRAARLIGTKTYGKGVVQQVFPLSGGGELKVTVASWYRPDGENIQGKGITPDQTVTLSDADAKAGNDTQLQAAQAYLAAH